MARNGLCEEGSSTDPFFNIFIDIQKSFYYLNIMAPILLCLDKNGSRKTLSLAVGKTVCLLLINEHTDLDLESMLEQPTLLKRFILLKI